jgi:hypothetical protein
MSGRGREKLDGHAVEREEGRRYAVFQWEIRSDAEQPKDGALEVVVARHRRRKIGTRAGDRSRAPLPSPSTSSRLAVSVRTHLRPERLGANPPQFRIPRSARRRRAAACRPPRSSVRTHDIGLLSGSCHLAVILGLSKMQTGR